MSQSGRPIEFPVEGLAEDGIRLRLLAEADLPAVIEACRDPEIPRWTRVPYDYEEPQAREWLELSGNQQAAGEGLGLLVVDADTGELLGSVGLVEVNFDERRAEIGYWLVAAHRGRGVMTKAVRVLSAWAFEALGIERLSISAEPENTASRRVAERAGFTYEGVMRAWHLNKGTRRDCAMYSLLPGELP